MPAKNPLPSPLLPSLAKSPQTQQELQALWQFLFLLQESTGGAGTDLVGQTSESVQASESRKSYSLNENKTKLEQLAANLKTERVVTRLNTSLDQLSAIVNTERLSLKQDLSSIKAELKTERQKTAALEQKIHQLIASIETNG